MAHACPGRLLVFYMCMVWGGDSGENRCGTRICLPAPQSIANSLSGRLHFKEVVKRRIYIPQATMTRVGQSSLDHSSMHYTKRNNMYDFAEWVYEKS